MTDAGTPRPEAVPIAPPATGEALPAYAPPGGYVLAPTAQPPRSKRMGVIAFAIAGSLFVATIAVSIIIGLGAAPFAVRSAGGFHYFLNVGSGDGTESALAVLGLVQLGLGTALGTFSFILGIVAAAQRRGRAYGVAAIVLAALAPFATFAVTLGVVGASLH
jgi:hypothetical protein